MQVVRLDTQIFTLQVTSLTPVTGPSVSITFGDAGIPQPVPPLDPADAFALGDALKTAARKAGFTPPTVTV